MLWDRKPRGWATGMWVEQFKGEWGWMAWWGVFKCCHHSRPERVRSIPADTEERVGAVGLTGEQSARTGWPPVACSASSVRRVFKV